MFFFFVFFFFEFVVFFFFFFQAEDGIRDYKVTGVQTCALPIWPWREPEEGTRRFGSCCSPDTVDDARQVARRLGIPYYLLNTEREFDATVIENFAREYAAGRTPVPCVVCNQDVK